MGAGRNLRTRCCLRSDPGQLIAQLATDCPDLPILAVSGLGDGQSILQALRNGAKEFLTQPVVLEELLLALQRLQQKQVRRDGGRPTDP